MDGDTIAIGAEDEDSASTGINGSEIGTGAPSRGAVYVFTRSGNTWSQQAYVKASNSAANSSFGVSLSLDSNTLAVGTDSASTCIFTRSGGLWTQEALYREGQYGTWRFIWHQRGAPWRHSRRRCIWRRQCRYRHQW
ncbi:MAG TPA: hypothetical protein DEA71_19410 [Nitrospira sp.]|nr:hypothetical protein [Nitrospira sp.]